MTSIQAVDDCSKNTNINCELCSEDAAAINYCHDCEQYLCLKRSKIHVKSKVLFAHDVVDRNNIDRSKVKNKYLECDKHKQDLTVYCKQCDVLICSVCCDINHANHIKENDLDQILEQTKLAIQKQLDHIEHLIQSQHLHHEENEKTEAEFIDKVDAIRADIDERAKELKEKIGQMHSKLVDDLLNFKDSYIKSIENKSNEIYCHILALNNFKSNLQSVMERGSNCEIINLKIVIDKNDWIESKKPKTITKKFLSYEKSKLNDNLFNRDYLFGFLKESKIFVLRDVAPDAGICKKITSCCIIGDSLYAMDEVNKRLDIYDVDSLAFISSVDCEKLILESYENVLIFSVTDNLFLSCDFSVKETNVEKKKTLIYRCNLDLREVHEDGLFKYFSINPNNFINWNTLELSSLSATKRDTIVVINRDKYGSKYIIEYSVDGKEINSFEISDAEKLRTSYGCLALRLNDGRYAVCARYYLIILNNDGCFYAQSKSYTDLICTDGEKYIFALELYTDYITAYSTELQSIHEFEIPRVHNISYDQTNNKYLAVTDSEIHYFNFIQ